jgi:low affinity Fe/Cu permease
MNAQAILNLPFVQVALPIMLTFAAAFFLQNKRIDDINRRLDEIIRRLERIEIKLDSHDQRITRLEERTSPLRR